MPRRDGFPTNQELVSEFTETSRLVYLAAYDQQIAGQLDAKPYFHDKPLHMMPLVATRDANLEMADDDVISFDENSVQKERLEIRPISIGDAIDRREHLTLKSLPEADHDAFEQLAERIGSLTATDDFIVTTDIPEGGVFAEYTATHWNDRTHHISTLREKPSKQSIVSGKFFAEDMHEFIITPQSERDIRLNRALAYVGIDPSTRAYFTLEMTPHLPLNGHEPRPWLENYAEVMSFKKSEREKVLAKLEALGAPDIIMDHQHRILREASDALARAASILDRIS